MKIEQQKQINDFLNEEFGLENGKSTMFLFSL